LAEVEELELLEQIVARFGYPGATAGGRAAGPPEG